MIRTSVKVNYLIGLPTSGDNVSWRSLNLEPLLDQLQADATVTAGDDDRPWQHLEGILAVKVDAKKLRTVGQYQRF